MTGIDRTPIDPAADAEAGAEVVAVEPTSIETAAELEAIEPVTIETASIEPPAGAEGRAEVVAVEPTSIETARRVDPGLAEPAVRASAEARTAMAPRRPETRERGWFEIRWRQFRHAPRPVVRAVISSVAVAAVLGILLLAYDLALDAGAELPGGDLRLLAGFLFVAAVAILGAWLTYLLVPQPGRPGVRSGWSAALGLFAALPIAYLALVILFQVVKPLLVGSSG